MGPQGGLVQVCKIRGSRGAALLSPELQRGSRGALLGLPRGIWGFSRRASPGLLLRPSSDALGPPWTPREGLFLGLPGNGLGSPWGLALFCRRGLFQGPLARTQRPLGLPSQNPQQGSLCGPCRAFLDLPPRLPSEGLSRGLAKAAVTKSIRDIREADDNAPIFQYVGKQAKRKDRVFVWGFCFSGALGIPTFVVPDPGFRRRRIQPTPYRLEVDDKISSAACGYGFTLLSSRTTDVTKVWGMGLNKDSQIGFHQSRRDRSKGYEYVLEPSPVALPLDKPQQTRVVQVSCGRAHSLVLTDSEGVFSMGNNSYGQCGRKVVEGEIYSESQLINRLPQLEDRVVQVACGQDHSLFRTEKGDVYACGWGADGQTGLGHYDIVSTPTKLGGDIAGVRIAQVSTCGDCCLAVSEDGDIFGWGNSEYLQLSLVTESTQVNVPRHLPFKVGKVKEAACGGTVNALLNEEGHVFVWGYGILGKGPKLMETGTPEMIPPTLFGLSDFNPDVRVARIRCGLSQFAAVTNKGELFVWGKNVRGCLGIGRMEDQYFPWRVIVPGEVVDVACGVDHMVTLVKSFV
uniref:RCC1-like G exchanging factor-like protein n=1 Tax=Podarcis muralis TaxID=64176 RepID=A0A670JM72_PODMU|nr:RCC1-like G exchanging factor-like protein [Podarcis muralis]